MIKSNVVIIFLSIVCLFLFFLILIKEEKIECSVGSEKYFSRNGIHCIVPPIIKGY